MSTQCSIALLESALAGNLPADDEASLHCHLEECEKCSAALERMAGGAAWCQEAASLLARDELDGDLPGYRFADGDEWSDVDFTVEHLEPTDEPNVLGRLGGYDVLEIIGRGGMGVVLKAFDRELKRCVAIKVLSPQLALSSLARKRFAREAQAAAAVVHPNVLAIHQVQPNGPLPFLVMPLVAGESLAGRLTAQGRLELKEVLRVGMQVAAGLAAAHEQGLVHRDVKPANILLEKGIERAVITDFGLARAADDVALTRWGIIAGTPQYMSPEQARGEALDGRSDLFSLGCVLYEMATGVSPFRSDSMMATMRRLVDDRPQAMASLNPELPPWFIAIVDRLLEKDPSQRFGSAKEVSNLLEGCLAHVQQPANVPLPDVLITPTNADHASMVPGRCPRDEKTSRRSVMSTFFVSPIRIYFKGVLVMIAFLGIAFLEMVLTADPPNIAGQWTGEDWGQVVLKKMNDAEYTGTYSETDSKQPGEIQLKWSRIERRFNGTWREGDDRFGDISIHRVGEEIRGAITTDAKSKINPATPRLADLTWTHRVVDHGGRADAAAPHAHALQFDGTRYATLPQSLKFTSGDFTISLWFNPTTVAKFLFMRGFAYRDHQGDIGLGIGIESGNVEFKVRTADSQWLFGWMESRLYSPINLNRWNHVVVTRRGDTYTMWMNGVKVRSEVSRADISDTEDTNPFIVGGMMTDGGVRDLFQGALDDFRIVHRCLSDREIAALYNHGDGIDGSPAQAPADGGLVTGYAFHSVTPVAFDGSGARMLHFDGRSAYVDLGPALDFTKDSAFSVSFWMNSTGRNQQWIEEYERSEWRGKTEFNVDQQMIVGKSAGFLDHSAPGWAVFTANGGFLYFQLNAASEFRASELQAGELNMRLCDGQWHHVVVAYNGNQDLSGVAFYIDGKAQTLGADSNSLHAGDIRNEVHATMGATSTRQGFYPGALNEMQIFDRALTAADAAKLYAGGAGNYGAVGVRGLAAGYHLNEGRGTTVHDFSGHGNDGTLHGGATWGWGSGAGDSAAAHAHALQFDGRAGSYVTIPNMDMDRLTFATWVKRDAIAKKQYMIMSARNGGWGVYFSERTGSPIPVGENNYVWFTLRGANCWHSDAEIADTQWHFVAVTLDRHLLSFYIDGKPAGNASMGYTIDSGGGSYCLGGAGNDPKSSFNGCLGETLVFNQPLGAADIARLHNRGRDMYRSGRTLGVIAGYHFDEGRGTIAHDFSGHGNDGTLQGGVSWSPAASAPHAHALHFGGTRYATLPQSLKFTAGDFTISLWFNPTTDSDFQFLFMRGFAYRDRQGDIGLKINRNSGDLDFHAYTADSQWIFGWDVPETRLRSAFRLNQWNHVVVTRCGNSYTMWMNGVNVGKEDSAADISDTGDTNPLIVGGMMTESGVRDLFQGPLDDFRIFHRCLSDREIAALYNHGNGLDGSSAQAPADSGLVTGFQFHRLTFPLPPADPDGPNFFLNPNQPPRRPITDPTSAKQSPASVSRTFLLRFKLASDMADDLRQILLGRPGQEAKPSARNNSIDLTAPPEVMNRVTTFITVTDWPDGITRRSNSEYPRDNVARAARTFFYACAIEDTDAVFSKLLSLHLLAELKGDTKSKNFFNYNMGEAPDPEWEKSLRSDWPGKKEAIQRLVHQWNRYPLIRITEDPGVAIGFGVKHFCSVSFDGAPKDFYTITIEPGRTEGSKGSFFFSSLPPWWEATEKKDAIPSPPLPPLKPKAADEPSGKTRSASPLTR